MLFKTIVALFIVSSLSTTIGLTPKGIRNLVEDNGKVLRLSLVDKKLVEWYTYHSGELPEAENGSLSQVNLQMMGIHMLDMTGISYVKLADDIFELTASNADGSSIASLNSGKQLSCDKRISF